jgi:Immunoglobulin domain
MITIIKLFAVIAPEITGPPEDVSGPLHSDLALSCEAKGNPIPDIHWEFKGDNGNSKNLPSERIFSLEKNNPNCRRASCNFCIQLD